MRCAAVINYAGRTTFGFWTFAAALLVELVNVVQRGASWDGDVLLAADAQSIATFVIGPLLCAVVAVDTARYSDPSLLHLVRFSTPPRHPYVFTALAAWVPVAVVHLGVGAACIAINATPAHGASTVLMAVLQLVVQALALLTFASVGSFLGRFVSRLAAGVLGVAAALGVFYLQASAGDGFQLLKIGGATVSRIGLLYSVPYLVAQVVGLLIVSCALLLVPSVGRRGRAFPSPVAAVAGVIALAVVVVPLPWLPHTRWVEDPRPPTDCAGAPAVCLFAEHAASRAGYRAQVERLVQAADAAGYDAFVPTRVEEMSRTFVPSPKNGERVFPLSTSTADPDGPSLVMTMLTPAHCPQLQADAGPDEAFIDAHEALASTWLVVSGVPKADVAVMFGRVEPVVLSPDDAAALEQRLASCDFGSAGAVP